MSVYFIFVNSLNYWSINKCIWLVYPDGDCQTDLDCRGLPAICEGIPKRCRFGCSNSLTCADGSCTSVTRATGAAHSVCMVQCDGLYIHCPHNQKCVGETIISINKLSTFLQCNTIFIVQHLPFCNDNDNSCVFKRHYFSMFPLLCHKLSNTI